MISYLYSDQGTVVTVWCRIDNCITHITHPVRVKSKGGKCVYAFSAHFIVTHIKALRCGSNSVTCNYFLPRKRSLDVPLPRLRLPTSNCSLLLIYLSRKDERLSRPGWLTYSGQFTHISGHPSAAGQGKFACRRPAFYHCTTQPTCDVSNNRLLSVHTV